MDAQTVAILNQLKSLQNQAQGNGAWGQAPQSTGAEMTAAGVGSAQPQQNVGLSGPNQALASKALVGGLKKYMTANGPVTPDSQAAATSAMAPDSATSAGGAAINGAAPTTADIMNIPGMPAEFGGGASGAAPIGEAIAIPGMDSSAIAGSGAGALGGIAPAYGGVGTAGAGALGDTAAAGATDAAATDAVASTATDAAASDAMWSAFADLAAAF